MGNFLEVLTEVNRDIMLAECVVRNPADLGVILDQLREKSFGQVDPTPVRAVRQGLNCGRPLVQVTPEVSFVRGAF